jgi:predicted Zn-dependent protease
MGVAGKLLSLLALASPLLAGCAAAPAGAGNSVPVLAAERERMLDALARLTAQLDGRPIRVDVSHSSAPAAYAWPDGRLLVTGGLVRLLDDDELAAALAHELGHLVADGHARAAVAALGGAGRRPDAESRADAAGVQLLARAGYPTAAMPRMLEKVAGAPGMTRAWRAGLLRRASLLKR